MMKVILFLTVCVALAIAAAPPAPVVSEIFGARINYDLDNNTHHLRGHGEEARNLTADQAVSFVQDNTPNGPFNIFQLARFDLGHAYFFTSINRTCDNEVITGHLFPHWAWLANASYDGVHEFQGQRLNVWNATNVFSGATVHLAAGFKFDTPDIPYFYTEAVRTSNNFERIFVTYLEWTPKPDPNNFNVPKQCGGMSFSPFF